MTTKLSAYLVYSSLAFGALLFAEKLLPPGRAQTMPSIKRINISVNEMVYDPISKKIYASVPSSAGTSGNSITVIDPVTATAGPSVFIGSEPNKLAVSDDGRYLYVGLDGARAVRRFNIQTLTPEIQFPLGNNPFGEPLLAADIAVMPGSSETVLVARSTSSVSGGGTIAIYDNGVQRGPANPTETFSGAIAFGTSPVTVFVFSGLELKRVSITSDGLRSLDSTSGLIPGSGEIKVDGNLIFTTTGRVVDPIAKSLLGSFGNFPPYTPVEPDTAQGKVFFLQVASDFPVGNQTYRVVAFNRHTFLSIGSMDVPNVNGVPQSMIRFGRDGIGFNTKLYPFPVPSGTPQVFLVTAPDLIGIPAGTTIVSAASFRPASSSAEAITTVFGAGLTAEIATADMLPLPTTLGGASVKVKDNAGMERAAPLFFVSPAQINFLIPRGSITGPATVTITGSEGTMSTGATHLATVSPAIFSANADGAGVPAAIAVRVKADNSQEIETVARMDSETGNLFPGRLISAPILALTATKSSWSCLARGCAGVAAWRGSLRGSDATKRWSPSQGHRGIWPGWIR